MVVSVLLVLQWVELMVKSSAEIRQQKRKVSSRQERVQFFDMAFGAPVPTGRIF